MTAGLVALGVLMVSTFRYWSLKSLDFRQRRSFRVALPIAAVLLTIWSLYVFDDLANTSSANVRFGWTLTIQ